MRANKKTRRGSSMVHCSSFSLDDCIAYDLGPNMSYNELRQLGIVLPYSFDTIALIRDYYVIATAPYADEKYFPKHLLR
jgi:hypothetical protein